MNNNTKEEILNFIKERKEKGFEAQTILGSLEVELAFSTATESNNTWEEELPDLFRILVEQRMEGGKTPYEHLEQFVSKQISEAEKRGAIRALEETKIISVDPTLNDEIIEKVRNKASSDIPFETEEELDKAIEEALVEPSDMPCCSFCKCNGQPLEVEDGLIHVAHTWHEGDCHDLKCVCHQSRKSETRTELAQLEPLERIAKLAPFKELDN